MLTNFEQLVSDNRLNLEHSHSELPITDFLFDWRDKYEPKLELFRIAKTAHTK